MSRHIWILAFIIQYFSSFSQQMTEGEMIVPSSTNDNQKTSIPYVIVHSKTNSNNPPIVLLQGGPGISATNMAVFWTYVPMVKNHDLILYDSRGTTTQDNHCTDLSKELMSVIAKNLTEKQELKLIGNLSWSCKEKMLSKEVDFSAFSTKQNARDLESLRRHLKIDKWILFGASYGTKLGLTYLREFEDYVESAILIGLFPPEYRLYEGYSKGFFSALDRLFDMCNKDEQCKARYPELESKTYSMIEQLGNAPLKVSHKSEEFILNPQDVVLILHMMLYKKSTIGQIPSFIYAIDKRNEEVISKSISIMEKVFLSLNYSTFWSIMAYDELPFNRSEAISTDFSKNKRLGPGPAIFISDQNIMKEWHPFRAEKVAKNPVLVNTPILLLNGSLDPITPQENAQKMNEYLPNSRLQLFPFEGHSLINSCLFNYVTEFLEGNYELADLDCPDKNIKWQ